MTQRILMLTLLAIFGTACRGDGPEGATMQEAGATADVAMATAGSDLATAGSEVGSDLATAGSEAGEAMDDAAKAIEDRLSAQVWGWAGTTLTGGESTTIADKENYTVTFIPGGTVAIKADCKTAGGTYTADDTRLIFDLEAATTDACAAGSMADTFLEQLQKADTYLVEDGMLTIGLVNDEGAMLFED